MVTIPPPPPLNGRLKQKKIGKNDSLFVEAIEKPDKVTVSSDYSASSSCAFDFVISMLEHEHSFLFWKKGDCHSLFNMPMCSAAAEGSRYRSTGLIPLIVPTECIAQSALTWIAE